MKKGISNLLSVYLILSSCVFVDLVAQDLPFVYQVENTGSNCPQPVLPSFNALPVVDLLTDPFEWSDRSGRSTNFSDWSCRRAEIKAEIENYEIGTKPVVTSSQITASFSGNTLTVNVSANGQTLTLTCTVNLPSGPGPFPAVIGMNSATGSLPSSIFTSRNMATITYSHDQVTTYYNHSSSDPYYKLYPELWGNSGQYSGWAWGVSRIIDGLEKVQSSLNIDLNHIAVTGCSYAGKMALFAGALDERIALTIAQEPGGGGAAAWRVSKTIGDVETLCATNHQWFKEDMFQFCGYESKLPHDHHELMAMVAPRALLILGNTDYEWLAEESGYVSCRAAHEVWKTFGISDRFGFSIVGGHSHCALPSSQYPEVEAFVEKFLLNNTNANTNVTKNPFPNVDYSSWFDWWGNGSNLPAANAGPDQTATDSDNNGNEVVTLDGSGSTDPDGSISSYIWTEGGSQIASGVAPSVSLSVGTHTITLTVTDNDGNIDTDDVIITVNPGGTTGDESIWLEAECGTVGSLWNTVSDGNASNDKYVTVQSGNNSTESAPSNPSGQISYTFNVSEGGSYSLWARVITPNGNDDSFWISVDGGSWFLWNNIGPNSSWAWEQAQTYSLATGSHTLTVAYREDGALLDKIFVSNTGATPSGEGSAASNCGGSTEDYTIAVRAKGTNGSEQITLAVGGTAVQTWTLGTSMGNYTATTSLSGNITVEFINDDGTNRDVQVDYIQINGATTLQAEDQATNTGAWQNSSCGGQYSEWLHCNGYIEFSAFKSAGAIGIGEFPENNNISLYPNPAGDILNIFVPGLGKGTAALSIYNINGKAVKTAIVEKGENSININGQETGLYVVVVNYNNELVTRKFMKK
jgi:dienelactone hydrolase